MRLLQPRILLAASFASAFAIAASLAPSGAPPQADEQTVPVAGSVSMLIGDQCGNIGVTVGADGVLMVDDQLEPLAPRVQAAIDALAKGAKPPRFVINTHFHGDHTGANGVFGKGSTILAQENVRKRLLAPADGKPVDPASLPVITFDDGLSMYFNGEEIRVKHFANCHTDGDSIVLFTKSNVAHLGDLFFNGMFPFVDQKSGGSVRGLERAIGELLKTLPDGVAIIPGHGPLAKRADLESYRAMLVESLAVVGKAVAEGKSAKEIVAAKPLAKYDKLACPFVSTDKWVETVAAEFATERK